MKNPELKKLSDEMLENVVGGMESAPLAADEIKYNRISTINFCASLVGLGFSAVNGFKSLGYHIKSEFTGDSRERYKLKEKSWNSGMKAIGALVGTYAISYEIDKYARQKYHIDADD